MVASGRAMRRPMHSGSHPMTPKPYLAARGPLSAKAALPAVPENSDWTLRVDGADADEERVRDSWLAIADGLVGTVGSPLTGFAQARREVIAANVYIGFGPATDLLRVPNWTRLAGMLLTDQPVRRVLDLRTGLLHHEATSTAGAFRAVSLASRAAPGIGVLRAVGARSATLALRPHGTCAGCSALPTRTPSRLRPA